MNIDGMAKLLASAAARVQPRLMSAEAVTVREAYGLSVQYSSGTISTKQLRLMGHPFAVRNPQNPPDPSIVNDQGGGFRSAWHEIYPARHGDTILSGVNNDDPAAAFLFGQPRPKSLMVYRPLPDRVQAAVQPARLRRIDAALDSTFKP